MIKEVGSVPLNRVYETLTPEQRRARAAGGGKASHSPETLAKRLAKAWPELSEERRQEVIANLAPLAQRDGLVDQ
jgi:hypothetical protein